VFLSPAAASSLVQSWSDAHKQERGGLVLRLPARAEIQPLLSGVGATGTPNWPYTLPSGHTDVYRPHANFAIYDLGANVSEWVQDNSASSIVFGMLGRNFRALEAQNPLGSPTVAIPSSKDAFGENIGFRLVIGPEPAKDDVARTEGDIDYYLTKADSDKLFKLLYDSSPTVTDDQNQDWFKQREAVRHALGESRYWELMFLRQLLFAGFESEGNYLDSTPDADIRLSAPVAPRSVPEAVTCLLSPIYCRLSILRAGTGPGPSARWLRADHRRCLKGRACVDPRFE
jgi:hypothetical protein